MYALFDLSSLSIARVFGFLSFGRLNYSNRHSSVGRDQVPASKRNKKLHFCSTCGFCSFLYFFLGHI